MICPKCGRKSEGRYCAHCGACMVTDGKRKTRPSDEFAGVDFVPEDTGWQVDVENEVWKDDGNPDLDETIVLEPLESYEPGERRRVYRVEEPPKKKAGEKEDTLFEKFKKRDHGEISDEKYRKYGRDPYDVLEEEEPPVRRRTVYEEEVTRKKKKKKAVSSVKSVGKTAGKAVGKTVGGATEHLLPLMLRIGSFFLMGILTLRLSAGFWGQRETLGAFGEILPEKNYAAALYLILAFGTAVFGLVSMIWIFTRRRMACDGRMKKFDTGRGLASFILFALLTFLASRTVLYFPEAPHVLSGLGRFFQVIVSCQGILYGCCLAGIVCCMVRKILKY